MEKRMTYEEEGKALMDECIKRRKEILERYAEADKAHIGMDGRPSEEELCKVSHWFQEEINKLREKYHLPIKKKGK